MKAKKLKKLASEFSDFLGDEIFEGEEITGKMREFWAATFGCNNAEKEKELLEYWSSN